MSSCCQALRNGRAEEATTVFTQLLVAAEASTSVRDIRLCLITAARRQQAELFCAWLQAASPLLVRLLPQQETKEAGELLLALAFAVCDRRITAAWQELRSLLRSWTPTAAFWSEWLNLAARMGRRGWQQETDYLLLAWLRPLLHADTKTLATAFWQLQLHFSAYVQWNGFSNACTTYSKLIAFYVLLLRRARSDRFTREKRVAYLQLVLRQLRDLTAQAARLTMQDELQIFRQWYQFFWRQAGEDQRRKQELRLLLQLTLRYWQQTQPKTSRKQLRYLEDLQQPVLLTAADEALLRAVL